MSSKSDFWLESNDGKSCGSAISSVVFTTSTSGNYLHVIMRPISELMGSVCKSETHSHIHEAVEQMVWMGGAFNEAR